MNSTIRLFDYGNGKYTNKLPIQSSTGESYTVSISKDFSDVQILDSSNNVVGQFEGNEGHAATMQAIKNFLIGLNCVFAVDNKSRDAEGITVVAPEVVALEFSAVPTFGQVVLSYDGDALTAIPYNATASSIQTILRANATLDRVVVTGSFADDFTISLVGVEDPQAFAEDSSTLQVNSVQKIEFDLVPDAGEFTLDYDGDETAAIAFDAVAADVQTALRAITGLSAVTVSGNFTSGFTVTMVGVVAPAQLAEGATNTLENDTDPVTITQSETTAYADVTLNIA